MLGVDGPVDRGGEHDPAARLQGGEGIAPVRQLRPDIGAVIATRRPPGCEPVQRRGDMAKARVGDAPGHMRHRREGRVHQDDGRDSAGIEMIVDLRGVEAAHGNGRKESRE